jgi:hypothetical protein|tara:strand:- start:482 stop:679 length:198 start_codon:yes stop_codon:yes gene_type:complete
MLKRIEAETITGALNRREVHASNQSFQTQPQSTRWTLPLVGKEQLVFLFQTLHIRLQPAQVTLGV